MKFSVLVFVVFLTACQGTLEMELAPADEPTEPAVAATVDTPADAATQTVDPSAPAPPADTAPASEPVDEEPVTEPGTEPGEEPVTEPVEEPEETVPEPGSIVEFTIAQGTGTGPWNSADDPVVVYVGQVLQVINLDDVDHQIHATDAAPIPHGNRLVPGQEQDYVVTTPLAVGTSAEMWDHNHGRAAEFWVEAREVPAP